MAIETVDQQARSRIHTDLDATLFVEAGAGTGKTRELIERIVRLVAGGRTELRRIAAITFTEAAAAELRDRLRVRLEQTAQDEGHPEEARDRCRDALRELDAAAIETLHAFAQRILTDHPLEARLPPLIEVQDEIRASIAFEERWDAFVDELLDEPALEEPLLRAFCLGLDLADLRNVARTFHENWDRLEDAQAPAAPPPALETELIMRALDDACAYANTTNCRDTTDLLYGHLLHVDRYRARLRDASTDLDRLRVLAERASLKFSRGRKTSWRDVTPDEIRDRLAHAERLRSELLAALRRALLGPLLAALQRFVLGYADERRRRGTLEFHDLLVQARDLLRTDPDVRRNVRERYSHLLIDEFQDTDPLQIQIAMLIAGRDEDGGALDWRTTEVEEGRLFFVGDPKQSIYRFRRADIDLYQETRSRFSSQTVTLTQTFRSVRPVIEWVNATFAQIMGADPQDGQAPYVALEPLWETPDITVQVIGGPSEDNTRDVREREASEIVGIVRAAKAQRWQVTEAVGGERVERDARYADIALLLPTRTPLPQIEDALEDAGIPYRVESQSLVYDTQEVRDLLAVLRAIDDPTDEVALIAALRSPAFACADDDLYAFAQAGGRWDYRRDPPTSLPADHPVVEAMSALRALHDGRWWQPISGLVETVIRERRLFELAFAHRRPRERWQRLRFVLDQARAFAEAGGRTLRQFIEWAERQADEGTRVVETAVPEPDDDAVRIMTIHAAKGLEFPIVILAGLNVEGRGRSRSDDVVLWEQDRGLEVKFGGSAATFSSAGYEALSQRERALDEHEKRRLLYVAATRARDYLIVSLHHKQGAESLAGDLQRTLGASAHAWRRPEPFEAQASFSTGNGRATFDDTPELRQAWLAERARRIESLARVPAVAATAIAHDPVAAAADRKDAPVEESPPWRRGRAGTTLGRAVHAVLQTVDLETGTDLERAARAQAAAEGIPGRWEEVAAMARAAIDAPAVREAAASGCYWRELSVAAPIDGVTLEGFVDLLYETADGLTVVDYKTDRVPEGDIDTAMRRYRLQGAAYVLALREALGRPVDRCVFVFARPGGALERAIDDLPEAIDEVHTLLAGRS